MKKKLIKTPCTKCKGNGKIPIPFQEGRIDPDSDITITCPRCKGSKFEPLAFEQ